MKDLGTALPEVSVIIPAHNPHPGRLRRTLAGLGRQTLLDTRWETILVDNASSPPVAPTVWEDVALRNLRIVCEPELGLTAARRRGIKEALASVLVLVDDDNVLAPDYLEQVLRLFKLHPRIGAMGGRSVPEFEKEPTEWQREFLPLLALRDGSDEPQISSGLRPGLATRNEYPANSAPIGAGMGILREAAQRWAADSTNTRLSDRRGTELTSGGDNDIVLTVMMHGWEVGFFPELYLTHLIPAGRLEAGYLARLNRGIQKSWMQVLIKHSANPWSPIPRWSVLPRKLKAYFAYHAWRGQAEYIRWQGACGQFEGLSEAAAPERWTEGCLKVKRS